MASKDIISSLPVGLIELILEKLPLEERVKTSVLSSKWRFLWTQVPSLLFDVYFYRFICYTKGKPISEYMRIISSVVLQYPRNARYVSLCIPAEGERYGIDQDVVLGHNDVAFFCHMIKRFLYDGVERLSLDAERNWPTAPSIFSPSVMSFPSRLTHLELHGCQFFPPSSISQVFPSLVSVKLESIDTSASVISRFLSSCPKLLKIELQYIDLSLEYLDIKAPELNYLHVDGIFKWLRLSSAENIETLSIAMCLHPYQVPGSWSGMNHDIPNLFHGMDKLEKIIVGIGLWKLMAPLTDKLKLPLYGRLKSIKLVYIQFRDKEEVLWMWNAITSCTNIAELSISSYSALTSTIQNVQSGRCDIIIPDEMKDEVNCNDAFNHLVNVFFRSDVSKVEMKLVELLLRHSPALERLSLELGSYNKDCQVVSKEIMNFCRTSPKAKVYIKQHGKSGLYL